MSLARRRKPGNRTLPPNLYEGVNKHFKYRRPDNGSWYSLGLDRKKAVAAAIQLNSMFMVGRDLVERVVGKNVLFNQFLDQFETTIMPERQLAIQTIEEYKRKIKHIRHQFGIKPIDEITVLEIADFLKALPPVLSNRYRSLLSLVFKYAVASGLRNDNPADKTMARKITKKRQRLTLNDFYEIYNNADYWLKNAMDLAILTLQRCEDLVALKFSDIKNNFVYIIQQKTKKHGKSAYIKIAKAGELEKVLEKCRDSMLSPYVLHRKPDRLTERNCKSKSKNHLTQLTTGYVSRAFSEIRDQLPQFKNLSSEKRPTFHEIRSLGAKLYEDQGIDAQALLGHTTRAMTEKYKEGHQAEWTEVTANLSLRNIHLARKSA